MSRFHYEVLPFELPPLEEMRRAVRPSWWYFQPQFHGLENVRADRPALFVGNHTLYGGLDAPLMQYGLYKYRNVFLRPLADHFHFQLPYWREQLVRFGTVEGSPANCDRLMAGRQHILVFPGGGREVMKNRGEEYRLVWKQRTGFARMAMRHGYDILPFASVGPDDAYTIRYDPNDFRDSWLGRTLDKAGVMKKYLRNGEAFMPLATGIGWSAIPRPEKFYFGFGAPISTADLVDRADDREAQWAVRERVAGAIYGLMEELFRLREQDPDWVWWRRQLIDRDQRRAK